MEGREYFLISAYGEFSESPSITTTENRRLASELAGLVVNWERQRQNEMKVVTESDAPSQINDVFNASSAESKRSVEGSIFPDDTTKRVKADPDLQPPLCHVTWWSIINS
jgi:transformation/transcription domain-associated protein